MESSETRSRSRTGRGVVDSPRPLVVVRLDRDDERGGSSLERFILNTLDRNDVDPGEGGYPNPSFPDPPPTSRDSDATLAIVIPLIIVLTTLLFLIFLLIILLLRRKRGITLSDDHGPTNLDREDLVDGDGGFDGVESRWLDQVDEPVRIGYHRAKEWQTQYPPNSQPTEITLSQFLSIQEKGVSAWSFEPDYESNPALIVQSRTEITFLEDGFGMAPDEGGGCSVQSNLPLPKLNEVYYWEAKMFDKPAATNVSIGLATKPFPSFRLPGWNRFSIGYHSVDGFKSHNFPFTATSYGPPLLEGDTLGVGYRPRTGTVFFTRNGKKLEDAFVGFNKHNLFPTVGADGQCSIHVNLGQAGFVFIEANVKKWGLAPMMGTLAPPPAYGSERGSILLESSAALAQQQLQASSSSSAFAGLPPSPSSSSRRTTLNQHQRLLPHSPPTRSHRSNKRSSAAGAGRTVPTATTTTNLPPTPAGAATALSSPSQPIRPSPLRHSRHASNLSNASAAAVAGDTGGGGGGGGSGSGGSSSAADRSRDLDYDEDDEDRDVHNPPTPGLLDISLHSIHRFPDRVDESDDDDDDDDERGGDGSNAGSRRRRARTRRRNGRLRGAGGGQNDNDEEEEGEEEESDEDDEVGRQDEDDDDDEDEGFDAEQTLEQRLLREVARERGETASTRSVSPPAYNPIDPHMYAPGVAETILEDAFSNGTVGGGGGGGSSSSTQTSTQQRPFTSSPHHQEPQHHESRSNSFLSQLGLGFGSTSRGGGGAIRLPITTTTTNTHDSSSSSPNSVVAGSGSSSSRYTHHYEGRTGRGGVGNYLSSSSSSSTNTTRRPPDGSSWFSWLSSSSSNNNQSSMA